MLSAGRSTAVGKDYHWSKTVALLACEGSNGSTTITDSSTLAGNWTAGGAVTVSTAQSKFGSASLSFSGATGNHATATADGSNFTFGTGDFTVEMWIYPTTIAGYARVFYDHRPNATQGIYPTVYLLPTGSVRYYVNGADRITGATLSVNAWYHIAVCRSGSSTRLFINGVQSGSTYTDANNYLNPASRPRIGANGNSEDLNNFMGYIDGVRVTKGVARYAADFTAPTAALPARG